jgi:hypothetical protein
VPATTIRPSFGPRAGIAGVRDFEGLIMKFVLEGKLSEAQALDHRCIERAIAAFQTSKKGAKFQKTSKF